MAKLQYDFRYALLLIFENKQCLFYRGSSVIQNQIYHSLGSDIKTSFLFSTEEQAMSNFDVLEHEISRNDIFQNEEGLKIKSKLCDKHIISIPSPFFHTI